MAIEAAAITTVGTVVTQARTLLKGLRQSVLSDDHKHQVEDALDLVTDVSDRLLAIQTFLLELQQENARLRAQIDNVTRWDERLAAYKLTKMPGGATVLASDVPIRHYACVACAESKKELQTLQQNEHYTTADCPACKAKYFMDASGR